MNDLGKKRKISRGITLIALVITIIILLILAGVTLNLVTSDGGLLGRAEEASFKQKMAAIAEELDLYNVGLMMESRQTGVNTKLYAGELLKQINQEEQIGLDESQILDIKELLKNVGKEEEGYVIVYENELYYVTQSKNDKRRKWCEDLGIKIWEYLPATGIEVVNGNYELVKGIYLCTPKINTGFNKQTTRYILEENEQLLPGNWINQKPDEDWYDYKNQKWANIYVESNGVGSYYVWIPRYVYKKDEANQTPGNERMDVKFVDTDNCYKNPENEKVTTWEELQAQGYQLPEAFWWDANSNEIEDSNEQLPGYWMSKYQLSELGDYIIDFSTAATPSSITIQNITTKTDQTIAKYTYAINGAIVNESKSPEDFTIKDLAKGNKAINITALNAEGEIIGSMTKIYEVADCNEPDLSGFDQDTTFYVYWDENGQEHNEVPICQNAPDAWYDYTTANWANIVTRNNGMESYYVWIPRYQYTLDQVSERSYVRFIKGTSTQTEPGYQIPEAFWWDKNGDNIQDSNEQLTGYWMSKYQLSSEETTPQIAAEMTAGSSIIRIKDITGTFVTNDLKYEYYLNGQKKHEGTDNKENYAFTDLKSDTTYTVNIIAKNQSTNAYVGAITKKIKTVEANPPNLTGFNPEQTYYCLYDNEENLTIGDKISKNIPPNWYDYSQSKWANIVVTDGNVKNGNITEATTTSYFVWIPRYEYLILQDRKNLDLSNRRTEVNFLEGTTTETTPGGYQIPEAFWWDKNGDDRQDLNEQLTGYWMSKYQLSE